MIVISVVAVGQSMSFKTFKLSASEAKQREGTGGRADAQSSSVSIPPSTAR